jgi:5'-nucleotidase/UDP-sugar diphosphatase
MGKKKTALFLAMLLTFFSAANVFADETPVQGSTGTAAEEVVIYHTNDSHGYIDGSGETVGFDKVAALKASTENSILIDAGDATQGLPIASLTMGADIIDIMNLAGYDMMVAGNHEFDFGTEQFLSNVLRADFPIVSANVYQNGSLLLAGKQDGNNGCHVIIERGGLKIGFFGLTTAETATATNPAGLQQVEFRDEVETAKTEISELEAAGADVIIAVCHMGDNESVPYTSHALAEALTGEYEGKLDAIIDGHSHTLENVEVNGVLIAQTGGNMASVGKMTVSVENGEISISDELLDAAALADVQGDAAVAAKIQEVKAAQNELLSEPVGEIDTTLWAGSIGVLAITRVEETNYGNLAADAFKAAGESFIASTGTAVESQIPVVAVENGGGIREKINNGTATVGDLITTFPFSNTLYIKSVTPAILYEVMEVSGSMLDGQDTETGMLLQQNNSGGFLQISGFKVDFDPNAETGSRVRSITLDGSSEPLSRDDITTQIFMVGNNYIMSGGNDYTMLGDLPKYGEAGGEVETIKAYLTECINSGSMYKYAGTSGRILIRAEGFEANGYTAKIRITDESGNALANTDLSYRVDGGERVNGTTDENGFLNISVSNGGHGVRLGDSLQEAYISNYSGIGLIEDAFRSMPQLSFLTDGSCDPVEEEGEGGQTGEEQTPPKETGDGSETEETAPPETEDGSETDTTPEATQKPDRDTDAENGGKAGNADSPETGDFRYTGAMIIFVSAGAAAAMAAFGLKRSYKK